jgi:hypothetical protein
MASHFYLSNSCLLLLSRDLEELLFKMRCHLNLTKKSLKTLIKNLLARFYPEKKDAISFTVSLNYPGKLLQEPDIIFEK